MHIYQRDKHVTEIQMLRKSDQMSEDFDCGKADALGPTLPYITLVNPEAKLKSNRCPNLGIYTATGVSTDGRVVRDSCGTINQGGFHSLIVGCGDTAKMEFHSKCPNQNHIRCKFFSSFHNTFFLLQKRKFCPRGQIYFMYNRKLSKVGSLCSYGKHFLSVDISFYDMTRISLIFFMIRIFYDYSSLRVSRKLGREWNRISYRILNLLSSLLFQLSRDR